MTESRTWTLIGRDGKPYESSVPGTLGGHRGRRIYGRFDCRAALQAIARGGYIKQRIFFLDESIAIAAGFRPCAVCMTERYAAWKRAQATGSGPASRKRVQS
ncbi:metal-binding protein [Cupriavidus sp. IDO]|uniref:metal-binding protein n=1 Tax=Cupriavidus sp. IDO TaxID=1539142 RepID=UPI0009E37E1E|nr:metal-binding protein [Cupriavidus sp. IDO]